jgi:glycosyltransferase involved in cell wall biosynthesis
MDRKNTVFIVPVYNEQAVIAKTVNEIPNNFLIICVNDGSTDNSNKELEKTNALIINHPINLGQGAALQTGIDYALQFPKIEYFVTFDADGQHSVKDAVNMLGTIKKNDVDIVLGSRFLGKALNISFTKKILLKFAIKFTNFYSGVNLTDTHNGLRVFNRKFAEKINLLMPGMAHSSEIIDKIGRGKWRYIEAPVTIKYDDYSRLKGQSMLNSVNILVDVILNRAKK